MGVLGVFLVLVMEFLIEFVENGGEDGGAASASTSGKLVFEFEDFVVLC